MTLYVVGTAVLPARCASLFVLIGKMKCRPDTTRRFCITGQSHLFRVNLRDAHWIYLEEELAKLFAVDKGRKEAFSLRGIKIGQDARRNVEVKLFSQLLFLIPEGCSGLLCLG